FLSYLGGNATPFMVMVYPDNFEDKDAVLAYLDAYNNGKEIDDQIIYTDLAGTMSDLTGGIMDAITIILIAFAAISLVVSLIMIGIITYTSVLERTKEIGVLRALGARKKDITRVFDAETFILGVFSGLLGIGIAWILTIPINSIIYNMTELKGVANLQILHALMLVVISTILTVLGGHIPAKIASRKDAVEALRSE
ncbi:MAG: FtsX-like permease family protein, partial [Pelosinus sp.]|nr:FtsX-like permease family protein [Pelosinus sp.]